MSDLFADRTPPQNIEAEQAVLGAIFLAMKRLLPPQNALCLKISTVLLTSVSIK